MEPPPPAIDFSTDISLHQGYSHSVQNFAVTNLRRICITIHPLLGIIGCFFIGSIEGDTSVHNGINYTYVIIFYHP